LTPLNFELQIFCVSFLLLLGLTTPPGIDMWSNHLLSLVSIRLLRVRVTIKIQSMNQNTADFPSIEASRPTTTKNNKVGTPLLSASRFLYRTRYADATNDNNNNINKKEHAVQQQQQQEEKNKARNATNCAECGKPVPNASKVNCICTRVIFCSADCSTKRQNHQCPGVPDPVINLQERLAGLMRAGDAPISSNSTVQQKF